jgi:ADP-heptose:LPS heptosyltransferase
MSSTVANIRGFSQHDRLAVRRLAVVRALHLGDLLLAIPALRAIRAGFPRAEITLIGLPWSAEFARRFSRYVDRWREFPGYPGLIEIPADSERTARFLQLERVYGYDVVVQMHGDGRASNGFALALGGRCTVGFRAGGQTAALDVAAPYPDHLPEIERNLRLASLVGVSTDDRSLEFPVGADDQAALLAVLQPEAVARGPVVGIHPGARSPARRWPLERFAQVADDLVERFGATIAVTGGPGEEPFANGVQQMMRHACVNLAGKTTLGSLAALIQRCHLFISNDTGPAHVAVALDRPSIAIFGPADRQRWAPLDQRRHRIAYQPVECSPCPHWECPIDHRCLHRVSTDQVREHAVDLLTTISPETSPCAP